MNKLFLISLLLLPIGNAMANNVDLVKNQVVESIDATRTLGSALEHRQRCTSFKWDEGTDSDGRNIVTYTCQMDPAESIIIWQATMDEHLKTINGYLTSAQSKVDNVDKSRECVDPIDTSGKTCANMKKGFKAELLRTQSFANRAKNMKAITITKVKQTLVWAIVPSVSGPIQLLNATYHFDLNTGDAFDQGQGDHAMPDVYYNNGNNNPINVMANYLYTQTNFASQPQTKAPTPAAEPSNEDYDLTCRLEDKSQMTLSHSDTTVYIAFMAPGDDPDEGGQAIKLDIASGGASQALGTESYTNAKYFVIRGTDDDIDGTVSVTYAMTNGNGSASYSVMTSLGKESESLSCLPDTIKAAGGLLKSGLSHVGFTK
ncbi:hypothetical protein EJP81_19430 [Rahnella aquatilis]|nr:hypothetical protein EJP79_19430 [Rahnella aquatilis]AZP48242.1 hypothetical protein EJP81_19430 [Rahnella aquatilis]